MTTGEMTTAQAAAGQPEIEDARAACGGDLRRIRRPDGAQARPGGGEPGPAQADTDGVRAVGVARTAIDPADFRSRMAGAEGSVMPALNEGFRPWPALRRP